MYQYVDQTINEWPYAKQVQYLLQGAWFTEIYAQYEWIVMQKNEI